MKGLNVEFERASQLRVSKKTGGTKAPQQKRKKSCHYSQYFCCLFLHIKLTHSIYSLSPLTGVMNSSLGIYCLFTVADLGLCYFHFHMGQTSNQDFTYRSEVLTLRKECRLLQRLQQTPFED